MIIGIGLEQLLQVCALEPQWLNNKECVCGHNKEKLQKEQSYMHKLTARTSSHNILLNYVGDFEKPEAVNKIQKWLNNMCPWLLALHHPMAALLLKFTTGLFGQIGTTMDAGQYGSST